MKKLLMLLWCSCCGLQALPAQGPYALRWELDAPLLGLGAGSALAGTFIGQGVEPLTAQEIALLDASVLNRLDRSTTQNWNPQAARVSDWLLFGSAGVPLLTLADRNVRSDFLTVGVIGLEVVLWNQAYTYLTKSLLLRTRPFVYNPVADPDAKLERDARFSLVSGHSSYTAAACFFAARVYHDYHPNGRWRPLVWGLAALWPATTAWLRVRAGKHFPTDVAAGYMGGALIGFAVPWLHKKERKSPLSWLPVPGRQPGFLLSMRF